jgi:hypothetical protein
MKQIDWKSIESSVVIDPNDKTDYLQSLRQKAECYYTNYFAGMLDYLDTFNDSLKDGA